MKKHVLAILAVLFFLGGSAQKTFVNDANAELRELTGSFNSIIVSGGIDLYLSQYDSESIAVSASSDQYKKSIKTVIVNNTLKIYFDDDKLWSSGNNNLKVYVSFKKIEKLEVSGSCDVVVAGRIQVQELIMELNGESNFKGGVVVNKLTLNLSGSSDIRISGSADKVTIRASGASDVWGYDLVTDFCDAKVSGASDINITVNKELNANASGSSDIYYKGNAIIKNINKSGSSSVIKKE